MDWWMANGIICRTGGEERAERNKERAFRTELTAKLIVETISEKMFYSPSSTLR